jgi:hypothetical protein
MRCYPISGLDELRRKPTVLESVETRATEVSPQMQLIFGVESLKGFALD